MRSFRSVCRVLTAEAYANQYLQWHLTGRSARPFHVRIGQTGAPPSGPRNAPGPAEGVTPNVLDGALASASIRAHQSFTFANPGPTSARS